MARPLMQHGVAQLEEMFATSKADQRVLKQLEHELQYRQVPRAVALLEHVQEAMHVLVPGPAASPAVAASPQPSLWDSRPPPPIQPVATATPPTAPLAAVGPAVATTPPRPATPPPPAVPLDEAYKLLNATPGAAWESIEQTRCLLVQASHPEKLRNQPESKRAQALGEARRINAAYAVLCKVNTGG